MDRNSWFEPKWRWLKRFCISGLVGAALLIFGAGLELAPLVGAGVLCLLPLLFWLFFVPILHWKDRYIGNRSNIWGAFLVFETSSSFTGSCMCFQTGNSGINMQVPSNNSFKPSPLRGLGPNRTASGGPA